MIRILVSALLPRPLEVQCRRFPPLLPAVLKRRPAVRAESNFPTIVNRRHPPAPTALAGGKPWPVVSAAGRGGCAHCGRTK
jgi:hypothetical protein